MGSLQKSAEILACFASEQTELSVTLVSERLGLPKSSVSRLMTEMAALGLLRRDPRSRHYSPGYLLFQLGQIFQMRFDLIEIVDGSVRELVRETGLTGYVGLLNDGGEIVTMRKYPGRDPIPYRMEVGRSYPVTFLSFGKALLARRSPSEIYGFFTRFPKDRPADMPAFLAEIEEIRTRGWAKVSETSVAGVEAIGVSIVSPLSDQQIGYSLSYRTGDLSMADRRDLARRLVESAQDLAEQVRDGFWLSRRGGAPGA